MCGACMEVREQLFKSVLCSHLHVVLGTEPESSFLHSKCPYPLSHLAHLI